MRKVLVVLALVLAGAFIAAGCIPAKDMTYYNDPADQTYRGPTTWYCRYTDGTQFWSNGQGLRTIGALTDPKVWCEYRGVPTTTTTLFVRGR